MKNVLGPSLPLVKRIVPLHVNASPAWMPHVSVERRQIKARNIAYCHLDGSHINLHQKSLEDYHSALLGFDIQPFDLRTSVAEPSGFEIIGLLDFQNIYLTGRYFELQAR